MTIKELIEKLQQVENQDIEVIIKGTDPTDWVYHNDIEDLKQINCIAIEGEGLVEVEDGEIDEDDDVIQVFVIDGGMF